MEEVKTPAGGTRDIPGTLVRFVRIEHKPLMTAAEWRAAGRPVWLVKWTCDHSEMDIGDRPESMFARTWTPLHAHLDICASVPLNALGVECGWIGRAGETMVPAVWHGFDTFSSARHAVRNVWPNGPKGYGWDRSLTVDNVQRYLTDDEGREWTCIPVAGPADLPPPPPPPPKKSRKKK